MFQSRSTIYDTSLAPEPWWCTQSSIDIQTAQQAPELMSGLSTSRWADASFYGGAASALPTKQERASSGHESSFGHVSNHIAWLNDGARGGISPQYQSTTYEQPVDDPMDFSSEVAVMDADGDVVMMDLNDPRTIMMVDQVARDEREFKGEYSDSKPEFPPIISSPRIGGPSCLLVIDTSFILSHLRLVNELVMSHHRWGNVIVMPWATIKELDGLKKSDRRNDGTNVSFLARQAINWAFAAFERRDPAVWGQTKEEKYDYDATHGDAAILDCCRYFHHTHGFNTVLLSHDKNLGVQAMMHSIGAIQGSGLTTEGIFSQLGLNPISTQTAVVSNSRPVIPFPVKPKTPVNSSSFNTSPILPRPSGGGGLHNSIYAYQRKGPILGYRTYSTPIARSSLDQSKPSASYATSTQNISIKRELETKTELGGLLGKIARELVANLVPLLKKCTLERLGDQSTLQHLNIVPEEQIHRLFDIEKFFHTHWMTVFTEVFPRNLQHMFSSGELNQRYVRWAFWAESSSPGAAAPRKMEIKKWIEEWDLIWKRMIHTEREAMTNMEVVDRWRNSLAGIELSG